jgi:hypothetical protein
MVAVETGGLEKGLKQCGATKFQRFTLAKPQPFGAFRACLVVIVQ